MKEVAAIILNRNLPALADELGDWIKRYYDKRVDIFGVENGSDLDKHSRYAKITFQESLGPARGINEALVQLLRKSYDYFWINFNDARYEDAGFLSNALAVMQQYPQIGIVTGDWPNVRELQRRAGLQLVSFFDPLGFVVSRRALEVCQTFSRVPLQPLWDSSNFTNHYNILGTALALYSADMWIVTDRRYRMFELHQPADEQSEQARGFAVGAWKHVLGPQGAREWLARTWPEYSGDIKEVRDRVIREIEKTASSNMPRGRVATWLARVGI